MNKLLQKLFIALSLVFFSGLAANAQNCSVNAGVPTTICPTQIVGNSFVITGSGAGLFGGIGSPPKWSQVAGPSVTISATSFAGGSATASVTGFTTNVNYTFRLTAKCSDGSVVYQDVVYTISDLQIANAGTDRRACPGPMALAGSPLNVGTTGEVGTWTKIAGDAAMPNPTTPSSNVSTLVLPVSTSVLSATYRWTVTKGACSTFDDVIVTNLGVRSPVSAGADQNLACYNVTTGTNLNGSAAAAYAPAGQSGTWTFISGPNIPNIISPNAYNTGVNNLIQGTYIFRWTVIGGTTTEGPSCTSGMDEVAIVVQPASQNITNAGNGYQRFCDSRTTAVLSGPQALYLGETMTWAFVSGPNVPTISSPNNNITNVTGLVATPGNVYSFTYTIFNAATNCTSVGSYNIEYKAPPTISILTANPFFATCNTNTAIINYTTGGGTGTQVALISAPAGSAIQALMGGLNNYVGAQASGTELTGFNQIGTYVLRYRQNTDSGIGGCSDAYAEIAVVISAPPTASNAGTKQVLACNVFSTNLAGNQPVVGIGTWSQIGGPNIANIINPLQFNTAVNGMINGVYTFRWIISGGDGDCQNTQSDVQVVVASVVPTTSAAGSAQAVCNGTPVILTGNQTVLNEVGIWSVVKQPGNVAAPEVTFVNANDPTTVANGLLQNTTYTFTWTISNACNTSSSSVNITTNSTAGPSTANAGPDQCQPTGTTVITLAALPPVGAEVGTWSVLPGAPSVPVFTNANQFNTSVSGLVDGTYKFRWSKSLNSCTPTIDTAIVTISANATTANAGPDQDVCGTSTSLAANTAAVGTGMWTQVEGPGGAVITTPTSPTTTVTSLTPGRFKFRWTITNNACSSNFDEVILDVSTPPTTAAAGLDFAVCAATSTSLSGNTPVVGTGSWTAVSGPNIPTFTTPASPTTNVTGLVYGTYVFRWTIRSGPFCPVSSDDVTVSVTQNANAGLDQSLCNTLTTTVSGNANSSGTWSYVSGPAGYSITPVGTNSAIINGLTSGTYVFRYTLPVIGACASTFDDVQIVVSGPPSPAVAGPDQAFCSTIAVPVTSVTLGATAPGTGTGTWSILEQPAGSTPVFGNVNTANTSFSNLIPGVYLLNWAVTNGNCSGAASNNDIVRITIFQEPSDANAGPDQANNCSSNVTLAGNLPAVGLGTWTFISGPNTPVIDAINSPTTAVLGTIPGVYVFRWTISNGSPVCTSKFDDVSVTVTSNPSTIANANVDQSICTAVTTTATLAGNTPAGNETGTWTFVGAPNGVITSPNSPTTTVTGLVAGTATLRWTIVVTANQTGSDCRSMDDVTLTIYNPPTPAVITTPSGQSVCQYSGFSLAANAVTTGTGMWSSPSGPNTPIFGSPTSNTTSVFGLIPGTYDFIFTTSNGTCTNSVSSSISLIVLPPPTPSIAGLAQVTCFGVPATLAANAPTVGTGMWSIISGGAGVFGDATSPTSSFQGPAGVYELQWLITNGACTSSSTTQVTIQGVLSNNTISGPLTDICNGDVATFTGSASPTLSGGNGVYTYQWRSSPDNVTFTDIPGATNPNYTTGALSSNGALSEDYFFVRMVYSGNCVANESNHFTVVVNPPIATNTLTNPAIPTICFSGTPGNIAGSTPTGGDGAGTYTYQWQLSFNGGAYGNIGGANSIDYNPGTLTNNTNAAATYAYRRVVTSLTCTNTSSSVLVTVNPKPVIINYTPQICSASAFTVTPVNGGGNTLPAGTTFTWTVASNLNVTGQSNSAAAGITSISQTLTNSTNIVQQVVYTVSPTAGTCPGSDFTITVDVNPKPFIVTQSDTQCGGNAFSVTPTDGSGNIVPAGTQYTWAAPTGSGFSGGSAQAVLQNTISQTLTNTTNIPVVASYVVTARSGAQGNCTSTFTLNVTVNPKPIILAKTPAICTGTAFTVTPANGGGDIVPAGTMYTWTLGTVSGFITGASPEASPQSSISQILTNTTFSPQTAVYNVTATSGEAGACVGTFTITVTVNPTPVIGPQVATACGGYAFNGTPVNGSDVVPVGTTYTWPAPPAGDYTGGAASPGTPPTAITGTLLNTTNVPIFVVYTVTPTFAGCAGTPFTVTVTLNPRPQIANKVSTICSADAFSVTPANAGGGVLDIVPAGTTYTWAVPAHPGVTGESSSSDPGITSISQTLTNTTNTVQTVVYTVTPTSGAAGNCVGTPFTITVTVNPRPTIANKAYPICSGSAFTFAGSGGDIIPAGTTYTWTISANGNITGATANAAPNITSISQTLTNITNSIQTITYTVTPTGPSGSGSCVGNQFDILVTVNPTPIINNLPATAPLCSIGNANSATLSYSPTSPTQNADPATFGWTRDNTVNVTGTSSGTGPIVNLALTNITDQIQAVVFTYTATANGCSNPQTFTVNVNPVPRIIPPSGPALNICNNATFSYTVSTPTQNADGSTFTWVRTAPADITTTDGLTSGTGNISQQFNNASANPISVIYTYTLTVNGCTKDQSFTITVNPTAVVSVPADLVRCNGAATGALNFSSTTTGATFTWTNDLPSIGLAGSGSGNIPTFNAINNATATVVATITVTPTVNGCAGTPSSFTITVHPTPILTSTLTPSQICNGVTFNYTATSATAGTTFSWTRAAIAGINGGAAGAAASASVSEALTNSTPNPINVVYAFTLTANGCPNTQNVTVRVNPTAVVSVPSDLVRCNGSATGALNFTSTTTGATFTWTNDQPSIGLAASGSGNIATFNAANLTTDPVVATITVTPTINGCAGTPSAFTITVNPTPVLTSTLTPAAICSNTLFTYTATSATAGTSFSWTRAVVVGISNLAGSGASASVSETLINTTPNPINVVYAFTLTANGCPNTQNFTVSVKPTPILSTTLTPTQLCNGATFNYTAASATAGTTFSWTRAAIAGINSGAPGAGATASVSEALTNSTTDPIDVVYAFTLTANGCPNTQNVTVRVNPTAVVSVPADLVRCNGAATGALNFTSTTTGATFTWTNNQPSIGLAASGSGNIATFNAANLTTAPVVATITVTPTINGCAGTPSAFTITVNPTPVLTSTLTPTQLCNGATFTYTATSATAGTAFSWTRAAIVGINSGTPGAGATASVSEALTNSTANPIDVVYAFTLTANGCPNTQNVTVRVNPTAVVSVPADLVRCNGAATGALNFTSTTTGATFTWTNNQPSIGLAASGSGNIATFNAANLTTAPVVATITVTPTINGCAGTPSAFTITVNPTAIGFNDNTSVTCSAVLSYDLQANVNNTGSGGNSVASTFQWTVASNPNVDGETSSSAPGITVLSQTLNNTTNSIQTVIYTVTPYATSGGCAGATFTITVSVPVCAPNAVNDTFGPFAAGVNGTGNILTNDVLADGTAVTTANATIDLDTATPGLQTVKVVAGEGTWTYDAATGIITFDPQAGFTNNPTPISYRLTDLFGRTDDATITMTYTLSPPDAVNDTFGPFAAGVNGTGNILTNDVLADGTAVTTANATIDLDTATPGLQTVKVVVGEGTWTYDAATGIITFDPQAGFTNNPTPISYRLTDLFGRTDDATITMTYTLSPPDAVNDTFGPFAAGVNGTGNILSNDVLADGTAVTTANATIDLDTATPGLQTVKIVVGEGTWTYDAATGIITFDPQAGFTNNPTPISYRLTDLFGRFDDAIITMTYTLSPPDAVLDSFGTFAVGVNGTGNILSNDILADGTAVTTANATIDLDTATPGLQTVKVVAGEGTWTYDAATGIITFDPQAGFTNNPTPISYRLTDLFGRTDDAIITMTYTLSPPDAVLDSFGTFAAGVNGTGNILSNDVLADGTAVTTANATIDLDTATPGLQTVKVVAGEGTWTYDAATGIITFDPQAGFTNNPTPISYRLTDLFGRTDDAIITMTYTLSPPDAVNDTFGPFAAGVNGTGNILSNDVLADGTAVTTANATIDLDTATPGLQTVKVVAGEGTWTYDAATGIITFDPQAGFTNNPTPISYRLTDLFGRTDDAIITMTYTLSPPDAVLDSFGTFAVGVNGTGNILSNDVLADGTAVTTANATIDLDTATPGLQTVKVVVGEGTWTYDAATGIITFDPQPGFTNNPTPISYRLTDLFGRFDDATIAMVYTTTNPDAVNDTFGTFAAGVNGTGNILSNDVLADGTAVTIANATIDLDTTTPGLQTVKVVAGEGTWTYNAATGIITFDPQAGFTNNPTPISYRLTDLFGRTDDATITMTYTLSNPDAVNDSFGTFAAGVNGTGNILSNDVLADGTAVTTANATIDLDTATPGLQTVKVVAGEGTWTYNAATGIITFDPQAGFTNNPTPISYRLTDLFGRFDDATIAMVYITTNPDAVNDTFGPFTVGNNGTGNILTNDVLADGTAVTTVNATIDLDTTTPGLQIVKVVGGEGTWTYNAATGVITFDPDAGFTKNPTPISYRLTDLFGRFDDALIAMTYTLIPPFANDDSSLGNIPGANVTINILTNDELADHTAALPARVTVDLNPGIAGVQTTLTVAGQGVWTYNPATGNLTFDPNTGFTTDPTPIPYTMTEIITGLTDNAIVTVTYNEIPPDAVNDSSLGNVPGANVSINILTNDKISDGTAATIPLTTVDIDTTTPGVQTTLTVSNQGVWTYVPATGILTFDPNPGFTVNPTPINYTLTENVTGLSDNATVTVTYTPAPPDAVNNSSTGNVVGTTVTQNIMANDKLSDGSPVTIGSVTVDLNPSTPGIETTLTVAGEGTWTYNVATGNLSFAPNVGFTINPTFVSYKIVEIATGLSDIATVTVTYVPTPPDAVNDNSSGHLPGTTATLNILTNDKLADGSPATPASVTADIDTNTPGIQTTLVVTGQGTWTYNPATGVITFVPAAGFGGDPTPIPYTLRETLTGLTDNATITVDYQNVGPDAVNDSSSGHLPGTNAVLNILTNDKLTNGNAATPATVTADIDVNTPGTQTTLNVAGQGVWTYDPATGNVTFDPNVGFSNDPTPITYTLTETLTGLKDNALITVDYLNVNPDAVNDVSSGHRPGDNAVVNILVNDKLSDGSAATAALVTVDIDLNTPGTQTTLVVVGQGTWTYNPANGNLTFDPIPTYNTSPTPIPYRLIETNTGLTDDALVAITYLPIPPDAVNDFGTSTAPGVPPVANLLVNDKLADGSPATPATTTVDLDLTTPGVQTTRVVPGEGTWTYNPANGDARFTPNPGYIKDPTPITYRLTEVITGLTDDATITMTSTVNVTIGLAKNVTTLQRELNGSQTVTYTFKIKNYGNVPLINVSVVDNLRSTFPIPMDISVKSVTATGTLKANTAYNGTGTNDLLIAGSTLPVGNTETIVMVVNVMQNGSYGSFLNTATATGTGDQVGGTATDISTDGTNPDPNNNNVPSDAGEDIKTPVVFVQADMIVPEGFSPNGDGINDNFVIENIGNGRIDLEIYNRWGNPVYRNKDYKNDWNGICNVGIYFGKEVPDGTYYYIVRIDGKPGTVKFITINR